MLFFLFNKTIPISYQQITFCWFHLSLYIYIQGVKERKRWLCFLRDILSLLWLIMFRRSVDITDVLECLKCKRITNFYANEWLPFSDGLHLIRSEKRITRSKNSELPLYIKSKISETLLEAFKLNKSIVKNAEEILEDCIILYRDWKRRSMRT